MQEELKQPDAPTEVHDDVTRRSRGFIARPRGMWSEPPFVDFKAEHRAVWDAILELANYSDHPWGWNGPDVVVIPRGSLMHSLKTIARAAATTPKRARTVVDKLILRGELRDDTEKVGFKGTHTGTHAGTQARVLTIVNYERWAGREVIAGTREGTELGTRTGTLRAHRGHAEGTVRKKEEGTVEGKNKEGENSSARETCGEVVLVEAKPVTALNWSREACDDWTERCHGTAPGGQIGKALKPLVENHGWAEVRMAWRRYLAQADPQYVSANRFANTYGTWAGSVPAPERVNETDAFLAELERAL